jgi:hypothetical protein
VFSAAFPFPFPSVCVEFDLSHFSSAVKRNTRCSVVLWQQYFLFVCLVCEWSVRDVPSHRGFFFCFSAASTPLQMAGAESAFRSCLHRRSAWRRRETPPTHTHTHPPTIYMHVWSNNNSNTIAR